MGFGSRGEVAVTSCDVFVGPCVRTKLLKWPFGPSGDFCLVMDIKDRDFYLRNAKQITFFFDDVLKYIN